MVYILIYWIYITAISYAIGSFVHSGIRKFCGTRPQDISNFSLVCISGLLTTLFISTVLCLFIPLAAIASGILFLIAVLSILLCYKDFKTQWSITKSDLKNTPAVLWFLFLIFVFVFCNMSHQPSSHHDDGLYYSTSVKWLQEYGTVKGLANINPRVAFDSSWLILQALYGFSFLHAGLFNHLNGLILLYVLVYAMGGMLKLIRGDRSLPVLMRSLFILPVLAFHRGASSEWMMFNFNFIESCTADLPVCLLIWIIFILFLESAADASRVFLVLIYSLLAVTIKLSALPILLLPMFLMLRRKKIKPVLLYAGIAVLLLSPWIVRNVLLSGYLFFPFSKLDLFQVSWKIPVKYAILHENAVMVMAADPSQPFGVPFTEPLIQWFPKWFPKLTVLQAAFFLTTVAATIVFILAGITSAIRQKKKLVSKYIFHFIFVIAAISGISLWLFKGPDFRFGFGFISIYCIFFLSVVLKNIFRKRIRVMGWFAILFTMGIGLFYYSREWIVFNKLILSPPLPYRMPEEMTDSHFPNGAVIHLVKHADSWNAPLPVANEYDFNSLQPRMLGNSIQDGFYSGDSVSKIFSGN